MKHHIILTALVVIIIALLTCVTALADVIWEPRDDFYEQVREDCVYTNRAYTSSGKDGTVAVRKEPGSKKTVATINNGNEFYVSFIYTDKKGAEWGVVEFNPDGRGNLKQTDYGTAVSGWVPMTDMTVVYDYISFAEDHSAEFKPYTGNYDALIDGNPVVFWSYPGSGVVAWETDAFEMSDLFEIQDTYTDSENRVWGFVGYYYGARNMWVCISDPSGAGIEKAPPEVTPTEPSGVLMPTERKDQSSAIILIAVIVAAVVIVTGVLIAVLWKKSAKKDKAAK